MGSVERQAKVAKEATKMLLEQFMEECEEYIKNVEADKGDVIEEGVIEILEVAGLTQTIQLEHVSTKECQTGNPYNAKRHGRLH